MKNDLLKETPDYKAPPLETPYQRAAQVWDDRIGGARVRAKSWRFACLVSLLLCIILAVVTVILLTRAKNKLFIAQLGSQGQVMNVAPLQESYQPKVAQYQYVIGQFIRDTMQLSLDPAVVKQNWLNAYAFVAGKAKLQLDQLARHAMLTKSVGKVTKTVSINSVEQITANSYTAKWQQQVIDRDGKVLLTHYYSGVFTVAHKQPKTQQQILQNPLGIQILYFTLQESK